MPYRGRAPSREDIRLYCRAIRGRWDVPEGKRQEIVDTLVFAATHPDICGAREMVAAARALLAADRINMEDEARAAAEIRSHRIEPGDPGPDFRAMSDEELERFIRTGGGRG
jgi:hypothetical protein